MPRNIKLKKGLDIKLKGKAEKIIVDSKSTDVYTVRPDDFTGVVPKLKVKEGDKVKAGSPVFYHKDIPEILFTSPVSGEIISINRGERRKILDIEIKADKEIEFVDFKKEDNNSLSKEQIIEKMLASGVWPFIKQRPYAVIANPKDTPKSIFISGFDSSPLAPDVEYTIQHEEKNFQTGIDILSKLTTGKINLTVNGKYPVAKIYSNTKGVEINSITGKHPAGNVGIQIHHLEPINKGDIVWTINPHDIVIIGKLFNEGIFDASRLIALTGSEVNDPKYYRTRIGASINSITDGNISDGDLRYISGNVLTGLNIKKTQGLGFYNNQITVIPEGKYFEFVGWALPGFKKYSATRSFFSSLLPKKEYVLDTNLHGGNRAFVMTGEYEKVLPMDIYPQFLLKSILIEDIDKMEQLGIYEVAEEDFALCEYICTSKTEVQQILRDGIELMIKEMS